MSLSIIGANKTEEEKEKISPSSTMLNLELGILDHKILKNQDLNINKEELTTDDMSELLEIPEEVATERRETVNLPETSNGAYGTVKIQNESKYKITQKMLKPDEKMPNNKNVFIYHTHTCESYTPSKEYKYKIMGSYRTKDLNYNVGRVGTELTKNLEGKGFNVTHDMTFHDYPAYSGSYDRSLKTLEKKLNKKNAGLVIDIHRDAIGNKNNYAPVMKTKEGKKAAQLMFVIGTNGGDLGHPNWVKNLKIAVKIQEKANEMYPGLFKPIIIRNSRYNQHVAKGAFIIEVGATGNTLEEAVLSMDLLANVLEEVRAK